MASAYPVLRPRRLANPYALEDLSKLAAELLPQMGKEWVQIDFSQIDEAYQRAWQYSLPESDSRFFWRISLTFAKRSLTWSWYLPPGEGQEIASMFSLGKAFQALVETCLFLHDYPTWQTYSQAFGVGLKAETAFIERNQPIWQREVEGLRNLVGERVFARLLASETNR